MQHAKSRIDILKEIKLKKIFMSVLRLYGRQRLRGLSPKAFTFFEKNYSSFQVNFEKPLPTSLWLEIGFGYGEHLVDQALSHPDRHYIGCEPFLNGMISILQKIIDHNISNITLHHGDARHIFPHLKKESLDGMYLLFPDPWPKKRHSKRRFLQKSNLEQIHALLKPNALWQISSDHPVYQTWVESIFHDQLYFHKTNIQPDGVITKYQEWALDEGRTIKHYVMQRSMLTNVDYA